MDGRGAQGRRDVNSHLLWRLVNRSRPAELMVDAPGTPAVASSVVRAVVTHSDTWPVRTARDVARRPIQGTPHMRHRL
eukprot:852815-Prymnesium_polylepis.1